ncbi:MAG TPA: M20/M25/M40 family metallo-hydrolase, partial [Longimicrobiaceae bacterium]|nr:M20/M25/M40 family metallo-hydrolase [Longimicrobiaceae bacterium]
MTRRSMLVLPAALAAASLAAPAAAQRTSLSTQEQRIARHVDLHADSAVALLRRMVDINSGTNNPVGVRRVGDVARRELEAMGFETRWVEMPDSMRRAGHLFAERKGRRGKRLLLIGHLDTVFEEDSPFQKFVRQGDTARGPGVSDMKGGNVVILQALRALHAAGALEGTRIIVALTGDEESPGSPLELARRDLVEAGKRSDVALEFEGGSRGEGRDYAVTARRSSTGWRLEVTGRPGHSSGIFQPGAGSGAIYEAARILSAFHEELRGEPYLTFNPGMVVGGTTADTDGEGTRGTAAGKDNVIAARAVATGDIRTLTDEQLQRTRERMRAIVARHLPQTSAEITFTEGYPSMPPTPANAALLAQLNGVNRDLALPQMEAFDPGRRGAADVSFVAPYVGAALAGMGVHGSGSHTGDETADLSTLPSQTK